MVAAQRNRVVARSPLVERSTDERGAVEPTVAPGMGNRRIAPDTSAAWDTSAQQVLRLAAQVVKHLVKQSVEHPVKHLVEVAVVPMPPADPHIAAACSAQAEHTVASVASASVTVPQTAVPVEVATVALTAIAPEPYRNRSTDSCHSWS